MYTAILCPEILDNIKMHNIHRAFHKIGDSYMSGIGKVIKGSLLQFPSLSCKM